jgi:hypothetical protein
MRLAFLACVLSLGATAYAAPYKPPADVAAALVTFRAGANKPGTPAEQPAIDAANLVFAKLPLVNMASDEVRGLLGEPNAITTLDGDQRWRYLRHNGEGVGTIFVLRIHDGRVATIVHFNCE